MREYIHTCAASGVGDARSSSHEGVGGYTVMGTVISTRVRTAIIGLSSAGLAAVGLAAITQTAHAAGAPPAFVQQVATHHVTVASTAVTTASPVTGGNRLIVEVGTWN